MKTVRWFALLATATVPASTVLSAPALATPGVNIDAVTMSQATVDGIDYISREITIQPGGSTGWHYHDGRIFGVIREGTLTHNAADCAIDGIYPPGAPITEERGPNHVHVARNLGPVPVVLWVVYIDSAGEQPAVDAPDPGCGFA